MDVLQLLKMELKERVAELTMLVEAGPAHANKNGAIGRLKAHLSLESSYLLPELMAMSAKNDALLTKVAGELLELQDKVARFESQSQDEALLQLLRTLFLAHSQTIEDRILPLMRQRITTAEREELFHVLQDAKLDLIKSVSIELAI